MSGFRTGFVTIVGRANVGKSTLLNYFIGQKRSIVTRKPQTTRYNIEGIKTTAAAQIIFTDTPGLQQQPKQLLNRTMNKAALSTLTANDVVLFLLAAVSWHAVDEYVWQQLRRLAPKRIILVINKIDRLGNKNQLLPFIDKVATKTAVTDCLPISATTGEGIAHLEALITAALPVAPPIYAAAQVTTQRDEFFAAEFIREQLINRLGAELPYAITVTIEAFSLQDNEINIMAFIWVAKANQKAIVIGNEGKRLKAVGQAARTALERLYNKKVNLKTWVKLKRNWRNSTLGLSPY